MANHLENKAAFLRGVSTKYPGLFRAAIRQSRGLGAIDDAAGDDQYVSVSSVVTNPPAPTAPASTVQWWEKAANSAIDAIKSLAPSLAAAQQAKTCISINADRARSGLPPIDCASSGLAPQVSVGISPDVKMIAYAALGLLAIWLLGKNRRN